MLSVVFFLLLNRVHILIIILSVVMLDVIMSSVMISSVEGLYNGES